MSTIHSLEYKLSELTESSYRCIDYTKKTLANLFFCHKPSTQGSSFSKFKQISSPISGIPNVGNSCYLSAALQILFVIPDIKDNFLNPPLLRRQNHSHTFTETQSEYQKREALRRSLLKIYREKQSSHKEISNQSVRSVRLAAFSAGFEGGEGLHEQHDAYLFLQFLLSSLDYPIISYGSFSEEEDHLDHSKALKEQIISLAWGKEEKPSSIAELLKSIEEKKQIALIGKVAAPILFIHLKRYHFENNKIHRLSLEIDRSEEINIPLFYPKAQTPSKHLKYQAIASICHLGKSSDCGHYTAYIYDKDEKEVYCNDRNTTYTNMDVSGIKIAKNGYLHVYQLKE